MPAYPTTRNPMTKPFKILILSAGSFLGQNILDTLETRRELFQIIGLTIDIENSCHFRCDQLYLVPKLAEKAQFISRFLTILQQEQPDLILPGRDDDVVFLAEFRAQYPQYQAAIPCGSGALAKIMRDKFSCYLWTLEHKLPFAASFAYENSLDMDKLSAFIDKVGYPLIAKPRQGFGSLGVYIIANERILNNLLNLKDLLFQAFLSPPAELPQYLEKYQLAPPLFSQLPENTQYAAQTFINQQGELEQSFTSVSEMVMGRCQRMQKVKEPGMDDLLQAYAQVLYQQGWQGFVNVQCKPDASGKWQAHEINLRMTGGTSSRLLMGYDELGTLFDCFYPDWGLQNLSNNNPEAGVVLRTLSDCFVPEQDMQTLKTQQVWKNS